MCPLGDPSHSLVLTRLLHHSGKYLMSSENLCRHCVDGWHFNKTCDKLRRTFHGDRDVKLCRFIPFCTLIRTNVYQFARTKLLQASYQISCYKIYAKCIALKIACLCSQIKDTLYKIQATRWTIFLRILAINVRARRTGYGIIVLCTTR